jgi:hypothetical protein
MASFSFSKGFQINKVNLNLGATAFPPTPSLPVPTRPASPLGGTTYGLKMTVPLNGNVQLGLQGGINLQGNIGAGTILQGKF